MTKQPSVFAQKVYQLISTIPVGKVSTYKAVAQALDSKAYRAVGQVLRCNPDAPIVPCHRVVASDGRLRGFHGSTDQKELSRKTQLLTAEGVRVQGDRVQNFPQVFFKF